MKTDREILSQAIKKAVSGGWEWNEIDDTWNDLGDEARDAVLSLLLTDYTYNLFIFNHDFARALWGDELVDNNGQEMKPIRLWANQVAVEHAGKIYEVDPNRVHGAIPIMPEINWSEALNAPDSVIDAIQVEYELKRLTGMVTFETHRLQPLEIAATTLPCWQYHLQQMVITPDPIKYLEVSM
jgi:hypothetical protein